MSGELYITVNTRELKTIFRFWTCEIWIGTWCELHSKDWSRSYIDTVLWQWPVKS